MEMMQCFTFSKFNATVHGILYQLLDFCLHSCFSTPPATLSPSATTVPLANSSGSSDSGGPLEPSLNPEQKWNKNQQNAVCLRSHSLTSCLFLCSCPSRENGDFEEVIVLPSHSRLSPPEGQEQQQQTQEQEERVSVVAFRENGLLKPVSGVDDMSVQQGAGQPSLGSTTVVLILSSVVQSFQSVLCSLTQSKRFAHISLHISLINHFISFLCKMLRVKLVQSSVLGIKRKIRKAAEVLN